MGLLILFSCGRSEEAPTATDLAPGVVTERVLESGQVHTYRLHIPRDHWAEVIVDQEGIDVVLELVSPQGQILTTVDSPNGKIGPESVSEVAERDGTYGVRVRSLSSAAEAGTYKIRVGIFRPAIDEDHLKVHAERAFAKAEGLLDRGDQFAVSEAILGYERASELWSGLGDQENLARAFEGLGRAHSRNGTESQAVGAYRRSLKLFANLGAIDRQATLENRLGWAEARGGNPGAAVAHYRRAENLFRALENELGIAAVLANLGESLASLGEVQRALQVYREALDLLRPRQRPQREADVLVNRGSLMLQLDRLDLAREDLEQALATYLTLGDQRRVSVALKWLADVAYQEDRLEEALDFIETSLEIRRRTGTAREQAVAFNTLGNIRWKLGKAGGALASYREALRLLEGNDSIPEVATILLDLARQQADLGELESASGHYEDALARFHETGDRWGEAASRMGLARVLRDSEQFSRARKEIELAVELVEALRADPASRSLRRQYRAFRHQYYELEVGILMHSARQGGSEALEVEAFDAAERGRARSLLDAILEPISIETGKIPQRPASLRSSLLSQLEGAIEAGRDSAGEGLERDRIARLLLNLEEVEVSSVERESRQRTEPEVLSLRSFREEFLEPDTLLLTFSLGRSESFLWSVSSLGVTAYSLPRSDQIEPLVIRAHAALQRAGREEQATAWRLMAELSEMLLGPVRSYLGIHRIVVVADGALHLLPFTALPDPRCRSSKPGPAHLLIEDHEIVVLPSISTLRALRVRRRQRGSAPKDLAVLADPVFSIQDPRFEAFPLSTPRHGSTAVGSDLLRSVKDLGLEGLKRLPSSGFEARALLELTQGEPTLEATGFAATRERALSGELSDYRILHFATHGLLHPQYPELSGLVLSMLDENGKPRNGFLRGYEIAGLDLRADLVVLGACRTGLGHRARGEGIVSLSHSFMTAGASRVVVSLWSVGDRSSAELMTRFYRQLLEVGLSPAGALRAAQLSMLRDPRWNLPRYWAGFVFQGDWSRFSMHTTARRE